VIVNKKDEINRLIEDRTPLAKAHFIGTSGTGMSNVREDSIFNDTQIFAETNAIEPPYIPEFLCQLFTHSNSLRQNIDAYAVNIDGNGHHFNPVIDPEGDDAFEEVKSAMYLESLSEAADDDGEHPHDLPMPTDAEVEKRIETIKIEMMLEKARLETFFKFCCIDESFISLRKRSRQDKEQIGYTFWEILRNKKGEPTTITYVPSFSVRLLPPTDPVEVEMPIKRTPITIDYELIPRQFRRFVQVIGGQSMFFKEYGDPRTVSRTTGKSYKDNDEMQREEGDREIEGAVPEATELLYFQIHSSMTPYGIPRWIGTLLEVIGSRQANEVNYAYFDNKSVPPMAIIVSGGRLRADSVKKLEDYVETRIKGSANFHNMLIIEGEPAGQQSLEGMASGTMKIEIVPLTDAQQKDALFMQYDEKNMDKVGMAFRLPRLLRGDIRDFNRGTAESALAFAESQIFAPERIDFDWVINRQILMPLGIRYWEFVSNGVTSRNPIETVDMLKSSVDAGIMTPEEARKILGAAFDTELKRIDEEWTKIPPIQLRSGVPLGGDDFLGLEDMDLEEDTYPGAADATSGQDEGRSPEEIDEDKMRATGDVEKRVAHLRTKKLRKIATGLIEFRDVLDAEDKRAIIETDLKKRRDALANKADVIRVPAADLREFIVPDGE
jgi:PBSX family phage portal protein